MSHDRGCPCGRESYDYATCEDSTCNKRSSKVKDTARKPSPCPECRRMRSTTKYPVCENENCIDFERGGPDKTQKERGTINKEPKQYIWMRRDGTPTIVMDLMKLFKDKNFEPDLDGIYELGPEVKLELNVKVTPSKPVYRGDFDQKE